VGGKKPTPPLRGKLPFNVGLDRILIAKACLILQNALKSAFGFDGIKTDALSYCFIAFSESSAVST
jgi:hypothetical protein